MMTSSALYAQFHAVDALSNLFQSEYTIVERSNDGNIKSVRYAATDKNIPTTACEFFNKTLKKREIDDFVLDKSKDANYDMRFERYQQYYHGIKVEDGHFNFRFKKGRMKVVKGHYVNVAGIDPVPSISKKEAIKHYASYFGIETCDTLASCVNLMIKEIPKTEKNESITTLTYKVFLQTFDNKGKYIGYIDAHTGKLLYKENAYVNYSATGQFYTYYNRNANDTPKSGITDYSNNSYHLIDYTRGAGILTGTYDGFASFFSDADNIWTRQEMGSLNMALDVHWTMENIYDVMASLFNHYSYDGSNCQVMSIIDNSSDAYYDPNHNQFYFGNASGSTISGPFASVDIIGHEYGHAILYKTTHISYGQNETAAIREGLADIWGIIFEKHITPNADYWKTGEQIVLTGESCLRNFQNPDDVTAQTQIASTYGCGLYYSTDPHISGGFLPYWFYLLVNGGSGTNGYNSNYQLIPVGFDLAEELFTYTTLTSVYLEDCTSLQDACLAFLDATLDIDDDFLTEQVKNSLYAIGVYSEPLHIYLQSYGTGSATYYVYGNTNCSVSWSITNGSGSTPSLVPNNSNYSCTVYSSSPSSFGGNLNATIYCGGCSATYSKYIYLAASPSSIGNDVMQTVPIDETHYQLSLVGGNKNGYIRVYDATSLQLMTRDKLENGKYVLDTSSWKSGLYIVEMTIGDQKYTTKISKK